LQPKTRLTRQHFNVTVYRAYFGYLTRTYPDIDIAELTEACGVPIDYFKTSANWVSIEFDNRFTHKVLELTGDDNLPYYVGQEGLQEKYLGKTVYFLLKSVPLSLFYSKSPEILGVYNKVTFLKLIRKSKGFFLYELRPNFESLDSEDIPIVRDSLPHILKNVVGYFANGPRIRKLKPANLKYREILNNKNELEGYEVELAFAQKEIPVSKILSYALASALAFAGLVALKYWFDQHGTATNSEIFYPLSVYALAVSGLAFYLLRERSFIKKGTESALEAVHELDQKYFAEQNERARTEKLGAAFKKMSPLHLLSAMGKKDPTELEAGQASKSFASILFLDIRGFTTFSENQKPEKVLSILNEFFKNVAPLISKHGGGIDKYPGDGIIAEFFNDPLNAINSSIEIIKRLQELNAVNTFGIPLNVGIGISAGHLVVGSVGYQDRMDITVIGDPVNTAARIESLNKRFSSVILVTEAVLKRSNNPKEIETKVCRYLGTPALRGKQLTTPIYEVCDHYSEELKAFIHKEKDSFAALINLIAARREEEARILALDLRRISPPDPVIEKICQDLSPKKKIKLA